MILLNNIRRIIKKYGDIITAGYSIATREKLGSK